MAEKTKLGGSLKVPCVQELAKEPNLTKVPPRYVQAQGDDQQPLSIITNLLLEEEEVPVIDMQLLLSTTDDSELQKFHHACKHWGFFQLINHGVELKLMKKVKKEIEEFFNMPMEEKEKYWQEEGDIQGFGQAFVVSEDQKLDWADMFYLVTLPHHTRLPRLFPKLPLPFRDTLDAYSTQLKTLALKILLQMAKALKMEKEDMTVLFEEGMQSMRMNYYPPCPQPELVIGLTPHSDPIGLTILLQLNEMDGLQVRKDGRWISVKPLSDAFIVNIGDILEIVTNGNYRSIEHRATVNSQKERLSIATFLSSSLEGDLGPAPSLISPETPALFRRISTSDYFKGLFSRKLAGKSNLDMMRVQGEEGHNQSI